ncbi:hypothetical protein [Streptomyces phytophilus]|uniref:hypothetical protein n=1 Tax=Streptomyces phytophilus TaxID=722715 RepID=UPI0015F09706|nr:hypothetical protein [Streptomyces phytophilus]
MTTTATQTKGQEFVKAITTLHHIGPRTRRYRDGSDLVRAMLTDVQQAVSTPIMFSEQRATALQTAWTAVTAYYKHIDGGRISPEKCLAVKSLSPYQFAKFLGRMVDAGIGNMGEAERWLNTNDI